MFIPGASTDAGRVTGLDGPRLRTLAGLDAHPLIISADMALIPRRRRIGMAWMCQK